MSVMDGSLLRDKVLGIIGGGNMAEAILKGVFQSGLLPPPQIVVSDVLESRLRYLRDNYHINTTPENRDLAHQSDIIILAVKPQHILGVLREIKASVDESKLLISIAAGIPLSTLEDHLVPSVRLIRVMPNAAAMVLESTTAIALGRWATEQDQELARTIFEALGRTYLVEEKLMDAITGLSGSGPAYIFLIIEALTDAGVKEGLSRDLALKMAAQMTLGAAKMVLMSGEHPACLKDKITSPAGTTIDGLFHLEQKGIRAALMEAVIAAAARSRELSQTFKTHGDEGRS